MQTQKKFLLTRCYWNTIICLEGLDLRGTAMIFCCCLLVRSLKQSCYVGQVGLEPTISCLSLLAAVSIGVHVPTHPALPCIFKGGLILENLLVFDILQKKLIH